MLTPRLVLMRRTDGTRSPGRSVPVRISSPMSAASRSYANRSGALEVAGAGRAMGFDPGALGGMWVGDDGDAVIPSEVEGSAPGVWQLYSSTFAEIESVMVPTDCLVFRCGAGPGGATLLAPVPRNLTMSIRLSACSVLLLSACVAGRTATTTPATATAPRVDYHQHLVSPAFAPIAKRPTRDGRALLAELDSAGVEKAVVLSVGYTFADE